MGPFLNKIRTRAENKNNKIRKRKKIKFLGNCAKTTGSMAPISNAFMPTHVCLGEIGAGYRIVKAVMGNIAGPASSGAILAHLARVTEALS